MNAYCVHTMHTRGVRIGFSVYLFVFHIIQCIARILCEPYLSVERCSLPIAYSSVQLFLGHFWIFCTDYTFCPETLEQYLCCIFICIIKIVYLVYSCRTSVNFLSSIGFHWKRWLCYCYYSSYTQTTFWRMGASAMLMNFIIKRKSTKWIKTKYTIL